MIVSSGLGSCRDCRMSNSQGDEEWTGRVMRDVRRICWYGYSTPRCRTSALSVSWKYSDSNLPFSHSSTQPEMHSVMKEQSVVTP